MPSPADLAITAYLRRSIVAGRDNERIGPFLASFSRTTKNQYLNYAIPDDDASPTGADIDALARAYETRGLRPRLEYLPSCAPRVEEALLAGGFSPEGRLVLMLAGADQAPALPDGIELLRPTSDDELRGLRVVQHEAYDDPDPVDDATIGRLRSNLTAGAGAILAREVRGGEPVGAGEFTAPIDGVSEITSIAVRAPWRRRGIAAAITARLLDDARRAGVETPFLMANEAEARVYARVGFEPVSEVLHISR
ncbi:MAG TPA: GNAT family N-acetyltransferase [Candidatus Limnocylindrales bacterium]|nr:GNAT family N-acetyltransferase [Candidatus Limnocylindrales bacterium]